MENIHRRLKRLRRLYCGHKRCWSLGETRLLMRLKWLGEAEKKYSLLLLVGVNKPADRERIMWKSNADATKKSVNFMNKLSLYPLHFELEENCWALFSG
jgi:hypothetical protein